MIDHMLTDAFTALERARARDIPAVLGASLRAQGQTSLVLAEGPLSSPGGLPQVRQPRILVNTRPQPFTDTYMREGMAGTDPILSRVGGLTAAVTWNAIVGRSPLTGREAAVMALAGEHDMRDGVVLPVMAACGRALCFSTAGPRPVVPVQRRAINLLLLYAVQFMDFPPAQTARHPDHKPLSRRERDVLAWSATGRTAGDIAAALGIRERTVYLHIGNAKAKLNAGSLAHAVALAMASGEITI